MSNENTNNKNTRRDCVTIRELARELMPNWNERDWFEWYPDVFFLTSKVMEISGAYRFAVEFEKQEYLNFYKKDEVEIEEFNNTLNNGNNMF